jgi:hypothetical protein
LPQHSNVDNTWVGSLHQPKYGHARGGVSNNNHNNPSFDQNNKTQNVIKLSYLVCEAHHELDMPAPRRAMLISFLLRVPSVASVDHVLALIQHKLPWRPIFPGTIETNQPDDEPAYRQKLDLCRNKQIYITPRLSKIKLNSILASTK